MAKIVSPVRAKGPPVSPQQFTAIRHRIETTYKGADEMQRANGALWYPRRHDEAMEIGKDARIMGGGSEQDISDIHRGAGIISALSPQMGWEKNIAAARQFAHTGTGSGQTGDNTAKALAIRQGIHPNDVLNPARTGGDSHKTWNFFQNIAEPDDPDPVTIDRHAHDLAVGHRYGSELEESRGLASKRRYDTFGEAYRQAGHRLGVVPNAVQAATWLNWTSRAM